MALKSCLYCRALISESAVNCPSCNTRAPLDEQKKIAEKMLVRKKEVEEQETAKRVGLINEAHQRKYRCSECGHDRALESIYRDCNCPECGYPDNRPKCHLCKESSLRFDPIRESLVCHNHFIEICKFCERPIENGKKYTHEWRQQWCGGGISGTSVYHNRCWAKKGGGCLSSFAIFVTGFGSFGLYLSSAYGLL
jgi:hypothetical protein